MLGFLIPLLGYLTFGAAWADAQIPESTPVANDAPVILNPPANATPEVHGPRIFGVRPGSPFLYTIPATGDRPMTFSADNLPQGLNLDASSGQITGNLATTGTFPVTLHAKNSLGEASRDFKIVVGDEIALTPPIGWNSWNCWGTGVTQEKVLRSARALLKAGLDQHGWSYINIDDAWQGTRGGDFNAIQPDPKTFPDFKSMADEIHGMGLKLGIYSTPWVTSYGGHTGGSSENPDGIWDKRTMTQGRKNAKQLPFAIGQYHFATNDTKQWAAWGIDYVKYDWAPNELPETKEMEDAIHASGRDILLSLSNNTTNSLFGIIGDMSKVANCWRIGGDINDSWGSIAGHGFHQDKWAPYASPGHWNDPDMFEIGTNGGGKPKRLTPDEQYTHVSLWCLLSAPLLLGCDLEHLDAFTIGLLSNDEVLDVDQDELGKQATNVSRQGNMEVYVKPLFDGSWAVGLFNLDKIEAPVTVKWSDLKITGKQKVRDLWRQKDLGIFDDSYTATVPSHGVVFIRVIGS
jgi:alpha-galactosidase